MNNEIRPGTIANEEAMVRSLKDSGFYSSGIPRQPVIRKKARAIAEWRPTREQLRHMSPEDLRGCLEQE